MAKAKRRKRTHAAAGQVPAETTPPTPLPVPGPEDAADIRWGLLAGLFLLALVVRSIALGHADHWTDEILFINSAMPPLKPWEVFANHYRNFIGIGHLPLPAIVQNIWLGLAGKFVAEPAALAHQPLVQRIPAVVWGSLTVPAFYVMARRLLAKRQALAAALMLCLFYFPVHFSREAYVYAPLLFFGVSAMHLYLGVMLEGRLTRRRGVLLFATLVCAAYSHITGVVLGLTMVLIGGGMLVVNRFPADTDPAAARRACLRTCGVCLGAVAAVAPFLAQFATKPSPHRFAAQPGPLKVAGDVIGKVFLGVRTPAAVASWLLLALGVVMCCRPGPRRRARCLFLALAGPMFAILLASVVRTQYAARYFYILVGCFYILFALGLDTLGSALVRLRPGWLAHAGRAAWALLAGLLAVHVGLFLPAGYRLEAKGVNYGGIARWLNKNLAPGTPYVMESAYELRFVSQYYPTPGLVPAVPFVHGAAAGDMDRLRQRQMEFLLQFPEACFVESARHGVVDSVECGVWDWPHKYFRRRADVHNPMLDRLARWGMWPQAFGAYVTERDYLTPIWYNTPDDVETIMRETGRPVLFRYDGWRCVGVAQYEYARMMNAPRGSVRVRNLRGKPVTGTFTFQGAIGAPESAYGVDITWDGQPAGTFERWAGAMWSAGTPPLTVAPGDHVLEWGVSGDKAAAVQGILIRDLRFDESGETAREGIADLTADGQDS
ncbi:MAG: glycosyltransferase family 39 protein [Kiritimatiellae bacterium]|nr:glycosyltransferase family 39 protein [Kiritimatiellia bacterium]